jgi:hypothetical protein
MRNCCEYAEEGTGSAFGLYFVVGGNQYDEILIIPLAGERGWGAARRVGSATWIFLISNFRRVLNVVCFLLGNSTHAYLPVKMEQSVPKRRHIKFRRRGITQKKHTSCILYVNSAQLYPNAAYKKFSSHRTENTLCNTEINPSSCDMTMGGEGQTVSGACCYHS